MKHINTKQLVIAAFGLQAFTLIAGEPVAKDATCRHVLQMSGLPIRSTCKEAYSELNAFFSKHKINDYADAAKFGRENNLFANPDGFNTTMGKLFKANIKDICPDKPRNYQALVFGTSGIDVFMERLACISRLVKAGKISADEAVALVGEHAHRSDLIDSDYLMELPKLFKDDFDLTKFNEREAIKAMAPFFNRPAHNCTHKHGMEIALQLTSCDSDMANLKKKMRYFTGDSATPLRTEQLLAKFIASGLKKPLSKENPIAFVSNAQGAAKTSEMIKKYLPDNSDAVDLIIARPVAEEIEGKLFNDTPQQRAMTKLFHFYRILETLHQGKA